MFCVLQTESRETSIQLVSTTTAAHLMVIRCGGDTFIHGSREWGVVSIGWICCDPSSYTAQWCIYL